MHTRGFYKRTAIAGISAAALASITVQVAPPAVADCVNAGNSTVCSQGTVRGGGPTPPSAGPYYPGYCADPWYCDDGWGVDITLGRPGGGGIGPRR